MIDEQDGESQEIVQVLKHISKELEKMKKIDN